MAVGSVGNPQSVVLERFKPASASAPRDAAVQGRRLRLYFLSPLWVGALLLLGVRISRQHEQRGYNRRSYNRDYGRTVFDRGISGSAVPQWLLAPLAPSGFILGAP